VITIGLSLTAAIEGFGPEPLIHSAWRYVFKCFNIATEHVIDNFFHFLHLKFNFY